MKINITEEEKEELLREYAKNFELALTSKEGAKHYFHGISIGIKIVLDKLGIISNEKILEIREEVYDKLDAEKKELLIYE